MPRLTRIQWGTLICLAVAVAAALTFHIRPFTVTNGSMRPTIGVYALVVVAESDDLAPGDIITFNTTQMGVVTHRIHEVKPDGTFVTKGDYNNAPDLWVVKRGDVIGEKLVVIPRIGAWFQGSFWAWRIKQLSFWGGILIMAGGLLLIRLYRRPDTTAEKPKARHRFEER